MPDLTINGPGQPAKDAQKETGNQVSQDTSSRPFWQIPGQDLTVVPAVISQPEKHKDRDELLDRQRDFGRSR